MSTDTNTEIKYIVDARDLDKNLKTLEHALVSLNNHLDNIEDLFNNDQLYAAFGFIKYLTQNQLFRQSENSCELFLKHKFYNYLSKYYEYLSSICDTLKSLIDDDNQIEERKINSLEQSQYTLNLIITNSLTFRIEFFKANGLKYLLTMLKSNNFLQQFSNTHFFSTIVGNINWLSKNAESFIEQWHSYDAINIMLHIARTYNDCKIPAYCAVCNIATDNEIVTLADINDIIPKCVNFIGLAVNEIKQNANIKRFKIGFIEEEDDDQPQLYEVYFVRIDYATTHSLTGFLLALYRLSVNDKIKYDLYVKHNLKSYLREIIFNGSDIEKKYALKLLAQLCFDVQVNDLVMNDTELRDYIKSLVQNNTTKLKVISKICEGILWSIDISHKKTVQTEMVQVKFNESTNSNAISKQVMISYNSSSRQLCLKIKNELEKAGYRVWIDINEIHGSSLEAMARAIETSDYVLICITEKYRQSINCQAEAQYAFKLQKPIIPLIMQEGYERCDGWLGMVMGDKIYINFMKFQFEEATRRLLNELDLNSKNSNKVVTTIVDNNSNDMVKIDVQKSSLRSKPAAPTIENSTASNLARNTILKWTENDVNKWFTEKNINQSIIDVIKPCDGDLLYQLHVLQIEAPEFFYQSITKNRPVGDLRSTLMFSKSLKELFDYQNRI